MAALIAQAKSNDEIAEELVIRKRTQIVRWAHEAGLGEASQSEREAKPTSENVESL